MPRPPHPWRAHVGQLAWPTLLLAGVVLLGEGAVWAATLWGGLPLWAGGLLATLLAYVAFTPLHDASHGAVGGSPRRARLDQAVGHAMSLPLLAPYAVFRAIHLRHHGATNHPERDPDMWVAGRTAVGTAARCLTISAHYYVVFFREVRRPASAMRRIAREAVLTLALQLALVALAAWAVGGAVVLALWVIPGVLASGLLAFLFDWLPHHPHATRKRGHDTRLLDIPALTVPLLSQNYHLVHHLYPRVPFYRYGALLAEIRAEVADAPTVRWRALGEQRGHLGR